MEAVSSALEWVQNAVFLMVGVWAVARWRRHGTEQSRWLAVTFLSLASIIGIGLVTRSITEGQPPAVVTGISLGLLAAFPYLLLRFLGSFEPLSARRRRVVEVWAAGLAIASVLGPDLANPTILLGFGLPFIGLWIYALGLVTFRFWRAGSGQPTLVRRRLRTLAVASFAAGLTLLLIFLQLLAASGEAAAVTPVTIMGQLAAVVAAGSFLLGFAPPAVVKTWWRRPEEHQLHQASVHLMGAATPQEVADLLVPHVRDVVGARGAAVVRGGAVLADIGIGEQERTGAREGTTDATSYALRDGALYVWTNSYTPFFGEDELDLLARLAVLADLALARTSLLAREQQARRDLEAANAELESFVYSASHDLKSPLIAIQSYLDVLVEETAEVLTEETAWYVERMRNNAQYMEALVGDLLELSRVGRIETAPETVDLGALVQEIAAEVTERHPAATVTVGDLPAVRMNPLRCRQLFRNLIENAATHGGNGDLAIWIEAHEPTDGRGVEVRVRDDGAGIPAEYRERVFGVFERLQAEDGTEKGTGIGLAICRKITETVGGRIWLTDHEDGAEFVVLFPPTALADRVVGETIEEVSA